MSGHHSVAGARHPITRGRCVSAGIYYFFEYGDERAAFGSFEDAVAVLVFDVMGADRRCPAHHQAPSRGTDARGGGNRAPDALRPTAVAPGRHDAVARRCVGGPAAAADEMRTQSPAPPGRTDSARPAAPRQDRAVCGGAPARTRAARSGATRTDAPRMPDRRTGRTMGTADRYPRIGNGAGAATVIATSPTIPHPSPPHLLSPHPSPECHTPIRSSSHI
jgi:hypothetical protein